jgi:hypothetical protein
MTSPSSDHLECIVHFDSVCKKDVKISTKVTEKSLEKIREVISLCKEADGVHGDIARKADSLLEFVHATRVGDFNFHLAAVRHIM